jgi:hypothetical protein
MNMSHSIADVADMLTRAFSKTIFLRSYVCFGAYNESGVKTFFSAVVSYFLSYGRVFIRVGEDGKITGAIIWQHPNEKGICLFA